MSTYEVTLTAEQESWLQQEAARRQVPPDYVRDWSERVLASAILPVEILSGKGPWRAWRERAEADMDRLASEMREKRRRAAIDRAQGALAGAAGTVDEFLEDKRQENERWNRELGLKP